MTQQIRLTLRAWTELLLLGAIWGGVFLATRLTLDHLGPLTTVAHRTFWAALALWGYVAVRGLPLPRAAGVWGAFGVMGLLNNLIPFGLMAWAQGHIPTGLVSILNGTTAVFGVLIAALVFADERLTWRRMAGVALGMAGIVVVIGPAVLGALDLTSLAQLAVLGGTFSYALAGVWARRHLRGLAPAVSAAGMLSAAALMAVPLAIWIEGPPRLTLPAGAWGAIAYLALVATAGAYLLYFRVLAMVGSGNLMLVTLIIPPFAILLGAVVLQEALDPRAYLGFALLAAGLVVIDGRLLRKS